MVADVSGSPYQGIDFTPTSPITCSLWWITVAPPVSQQPIDHLPTLNIPVLDALLAGLGPGAVLVAWKLFSTIT